MQLEVTNDSGNVAVQAVSTTGQTLSFGVYAESSSEGGTGIAGVAHSGTNAFGVWGASATGYAGYFDGDVNVSGTLSKSGRLVQDRSSA